MYRKPNYDQLDIYDFILPFGGHLDKDNRWVILRNSIDWKANEEVCEKNFDNKETGNETLPSDLAFGSLYIQRKLSLTDRELVEQISENPYMQYFIGFRGLCKRHGIRLSGPGLGNPGKNHMEEIRQELKQIGERNAVEGKFGNGKRNRACL